MEDLTSFKGDVSEPLEKIINKHFKYSTDSNDKLLSSEIQALLLKDHNYVSRKTHDITMMIKRMRIGKWSPLEIKIGRESFESLGRLQVF